MSRPLRPRRTSVDHTGSQPTTSTPRWLTTSRGSSQEDPSLEEVEEKENESPPVIQQATVSKKLRVEATVDSEDEGEAPQKNDPAGGKRGRQAPKKRQSNLASNYWISAKSINYFSTWKLKPDQDKGRGAEGAKLASQERDKQLPNKAKRSNGVRPDSRAASGSKSGESGADKPPKEPLAKRLRHESATEANGDSQPSKKRIGKITKPENPTADLPTKKKSAAELEAAGNSCCAEEGEMNSQSAAEEQRDQRIKHAGLQGMGAAAQTAAVGNTPRSENGMQLQAECEELSVKNTELEKKLLAQEEEIVELKRQLRVLERLAEQFEETRPDLDAEGGETPVLEASKEAAIQSGSHSSPASDAAAKSRPSPAVVHSILQSAQPIQSAVRAASIINFAQGTPAASPAANPGQDQRQPGDPHVREAAEWCSEGASLSGPYVQPAGTAALLEGRAEIGSENAAEAHQQPHDGPWAGRLRGRTSDQLDA